MLEFLFISVFGIFNDHRLVYYGQYIEPIKAINREKRLKDWLKEWQIWLIKDMNPDWQDLWFETTGQTETS